jgi:hypothetical protein
MLQRSGGTTGSCLIVIKGNLIPLLVENRQRACRSTRPPPTVPSLAHPLKPQGVGGRGTAGGIGGGSGRAGSMFSKALGQT